MTKEQLEQIKTLKAEQQAKTKGKPFKNLSTKEKDELVETLCKMFGLI